MSAHRYWRLNLNEVTGGGAFSFAALEYHATAGGTNVATGGTASASNTYSGSSSTNCFAGTGLWSSTNASLPCWIQYDLGLGNDKDIVEVVATSRNDAYFNQTAVEFTLQYSDDGTTWYSKAVCIHDGWTQNETVTFTIPTTAGTAAHAWWGISIINSANAFGYVVEEMFFAATHGGASLCTGGTARSTQQYSSFSADLAFDGNNATIWAGNDKNQQTLTYHLTSSSVVTQMSMTGYSATPNQTPSDWAVIYSDDGKCWAYFPAWTVTGATWSANVAQTFNAPAAAGETSTVTMHFTGIGMSSGGFVPAVSTHATMHLSGISLFVNAYKPGSPGTGLTQFWTF